MAEAQHPIVSAEPTTQEIASAPDRTVQSGAETIVVLSMLDSRYRENVAAYAEALHACNHEIARVRVELEQLEAQKQPYAEAIEASDRQIDHQLRMLEHFSEEWIRKTEVVSELAHELSMLKHDVDENSGTLRHREREIEALGEKIEALELTLLRQELERQNTLLKLEPIEQKIRAAERRLKELEAKKAYIESSHLHRIAQIGSADRPALTSSSSHEEE